ncbi:MAG: class I SAM-dependent methyltransferase [Candidatus Doudnabacteria bacterium]|nr:class I SAM-dependent methyltransferase [Candidatus Doudnabacteria bacterium]
MDQKTYYNKLHKGEMRIKRERMSYVGDRFSDELIRLADIKNNDKILDVGSGEGCLEVEYNDVLGDKFVVGIDVSVEALKLSKAKYRVVADAARMPFKSFVFDKVLSREVIEHLENIDIVNDALSEMNRILKTGGIASISTPNGNCLIFFFTHMIRGKRNPNPVLHPTMLTKKTLKRVIKNNGFDVELKSYLLPIPVPRYEYAFPEFIMRYFYYIGRLFPSIAHGFVVKAVKKAKS